MDAFRSVDLDETDWLILRELQAHGRLSYKELGRRVHMSAPAAPVSDCAKPPSAANAQTLQSGRSDVPHSRRDAAPQSRRNGADADVE